MKKTAFDNKWFLMFISLVCAVFLYAFVSTENTNMSMRIARNQEFASVNVTETISNVPVYLGETDENTFISDLPEKATVRLTGPRNIINQVTGDTIRVQTESLVGVPPGSRTVRLEVIGLPEDVEYQTTPSRVIVQVSKRETVTLPVEYEISEELVAAGYQVSDVRLNIPEVTLSGTSEAIEKLDRVYIKITSNQPKSESFVDTYPLKIVDQAGDLLDISANKTEIEATVDIEPLEQTASLNVLAQGESSQYQYQYQLVQFSEVSVQASHPISTLDVLVDVSNMTESGTVLGQIQIPANVTYNGPYDVEVHVDIQASDRVLSESNSSTEEVTQEHKDERLEEGAASSGQVEEPVDNPAEVPVESTGQES